MNLKGVTRHWLFAPAMGAALTVLCGFAIFNTRPGEKWENASYDYLFLLPPLVKYTNNNVVLVAMDRTSYNTLKQSRSGVTPWDRGLHTRLLDKLAEAKLVVFDSFFANEMDSKTDMALATAMQRQGHVVLRERRDKPLRPGADMTETLTPLKIFADAAAGLGLTEIEDVTNQPIRRLWPFPSPYPPTANLTNLPWTAAVMMGAKLSQTSEERWLRYYGQSGNWTKISYSMALEAAPDFFRGKVVFIGQEPDTDFPDPAANNKDQFRNPYGDMVGGVEILATTYLNLFRGDWFKRVPEWIENSLIVLFGLLAGAGLAFTRRWIACVISLAVFAAIALGSIYLSFYKSYWFNWMTLAGGQLPCALAWAWFAAPMRRPVQLHDTIISGDSRPALAAAGRPETPDYELADEPFGKGAYGRVWLARNAIGQWQALKAVYMAGFRDNKTDPYDREFKGITRYKPVSERHSGLLRIDFISQKKPDGYFYYVMELGDSLNPGWEKDPATYKPKDLASMIDQTEKHRLPALECIRIGLELTDALEFLHNEGLTHRDIKPQNIIFVGGKPKLADVGLVAEILSNPLEGSWVGTPGYMPMGEPPGTPAADIYGLGMVLYVIRTGCDPGFFPTVSNTLAEQIKTGEFTPLNNVIVKACNPDTTKRYASVAEMREALREAQRAMEGR